MRRNKLIASLFFVASVNLFWGLCYYAQGMGYTDSDSVPWVVTFAALMALSGAWGLHYWGKPRHPNSND